jgi:cellulose synthase/poly-beta-1,6-N-acetylglucosamine synthase-like glycosyltransferase
VIEVFFWTCFVAVVYVYAGYPLLLWAMAGLFPKPVKKAQVSPSVSLLVAAYNEADVIEAKIRNGLALDYPPEQLEIVVASDGSSDATAELAQRLADGRRVRVLAYPVNRGKLAVLNDSVPQLRGEIVAFSDASSMLAPDAIRTLVESFADTAVGGVSGIYRVLKKDEAQLGASEDLYWKYETFLKVKEAALGSILGGHGSLYAVRRSAYPYPPLGTINDDYVIPIRIVQKGYRMAYEPRSIAYEEAHEMGGFSRRVRIMTGNVKQLSELKALAWPPRWLELWFFLSHKVGRLSVPVFLIGMLSANLLLLREPLYVWLAGLQALFYGLALAGAVWNLRPRILRLPFYFSMINVAACFGVFFALTGPQRLEWKREGNTGR